MFLTVRGTLTAHILPEKLIPYALDIIRELSPNEQDLIRVVVEIVHRLRDPPDEEEGQSRLEEDDSMTETGTPRRPRPAKPPVELTPEQVQRSDEVDMRCLSLCIGMLERINGVRCMLFIICICHPDRSGVDIRGEYHVGRHFERAYRPRCEATGYEYPRERLDQLGPVLSNLSCTVSYPY